jgi:hypothetical protein
MFDGGNQASAGLARVFAVPLQARYYGAMTPNLRFVLDQGPLGLAEPFNQVGALHGRDSNMTTAPKWTGVSPEMGIGENPADTSGLTPDEPRWPMKSFKKGRHRY